MEAVSYVAGGRGLLEEEVEVDYSVERFAMQETADTRREIQAEWERRTAENTRLYNGSKYRLAAAEVSIDNVELFLEFPVGIRC